MVRTTRSRASRPSPSARTRASSACPRSTRDTGIPSSGPAPRPRRWSTSTSAHPARRRRRPRTRPRTCPGSCSSLLCHLRRRRLALLADPRPLPRDQDLSLRGRNRLGALTPRPARPHGALQLHVRGHGPASTPAEVFRRNFWFCAVEDPSAFVQRDGIGVDHILLESDYPHADSTWPETQVVIERAIGRLPEDEVRRITWQTRRSLSPSGARIGAPGPRRLLTPTAPAHGDFVSVTLRQRPRPAGAPREGGSRMRVIRGGIVAATALSAATLVPVTSGLRGLVCSDESGCDQFHHNRRADRRPDPAGPGSLQVGRGRHPGLLQLHQLPGRRRRTQDQVGHRDSTFNSATVATEAQSIASNDFAMVGGFSLLDGAEQHAIDGGKLPDVTVPLALTLSVDPNLYSPAPSANNDYPTGPFEVGQEGLSRPIAAHRHPVHGRGGLGDRLPAAVQQRREGLGSEDRLPAWLHEQRIHLRRRRAQDEGGWHPDVLRLPPAGGLLRGQPGTRDRTAGLPPRRHPRRRRLHRQHGPGERRWGRGHVPRDAGLPVRGGGRRGHSGGGALRQVGRSQAIRGSSAR